MRQVLAGLALAATIVSAGSHSFAETAGEPASAAPMHSASIPLARRSIRRQLPDFPPRKQSERGNEAWTWGQKCKG